MTKPAPAAAWLMALCMAAATQTFATVPASSPPLPPTLGVALDRLPLYAAIKDTFGCLDGSITIAAAAVNDNYCDCPDGSDEPGTSACDHGRFHCTNSGHIESSILSSRVNDGLCESECCDGSDEYSGLIACPNRCLEASKEHASDSAATEAIRRAGAIARLRLVQRSERLLARRAKTLQDSRDKLATLKQHIDQLEKQKTELESKEATQADTEKRTQCASLTQPLESWMDQLLAAIDQLRPLASVSSAHDAVVSALAVRDDVAAQRDRAVADAAAKTLAASETVSEIKDQIAGVAEKLATALADQTATQSTINDLESKATKDYGPDAVFAAMAETCVSKQFDQYMYKVCPLATAHQDDISLGVFTVWGQDGPAKYTEMSYTGGTLCWNGPMRSVKVRLLCGEATDLLSVSEPSKCEYEVTMRSPAVCDVTEADRAEFAALPLVVDDLPDDTNADAGGSDEDDDDAGSADDVSDVSDGAYDEPYSGHSEL
ncbi:glucosidase II beta subunit-like-domain-containing protein [Entophlyctis helioformis]|nr:glucosidase II beta subunit-like-domain-containing protein [Entophlyctis helioformis]